MNNKTNTKIMLSNTGQAKINLSADQRDALKITENCDAISFIREVDGKVELVIRRINDGQND